MSSKLLTIAIPTYNRCEDLEKSLNYLLPQIEAYKEEVDLIISDNSSTDKTIESIELAKHKYPGIIRSNRNTENIGYLRNFQKCVEMTNTEYLCLLGDDDVVSLGFVATILNIVKTWNVDILHYNWLSYKPSISKMIPFYSCWNSNDVLKLYDSPSEFIQDTLDGPSFMSSMVFKKSLWLNGENKYEENVYGYDWIMKIYAGLTNNSRCLFYSLPLVTRYVSPNEGYSQCGPKYYFIGFSRLFYNMGETFPEASEAWKHYMKHSMRSYTTILDMASHKSDYLELKEEIKDYMPSWKHKAVMTLVLSSPKFVVDKIYKPFFKCLSYMEIVKDKLKRHNN